MFLASPVIALKPFIIEGFNALLEGSPTSNTSEMYKRHGARTDKDSVDAIRFGWNSRSKVDQFTDVKTVTLYLAVKLPAIKSINKFALTSNIKIECKTGIGAALYIPDNNYIYEDTPRDVTFRFDNGDAFKQEMLTHKGEAKSVLVNTFFGNDVLSGLLGGYHTKLYYRLNDNGAVHYFPINKLKEYYARECPE